MSGWSGSSERASWYRSTDSASSVQLHDPRLCVRAGYPLVYYAQVEPGGGPLRSRPLAKKDNPNCFVKAFRWYTQEHNVHKTANYDSETDENKGYPEFATWLDQKYNQFLKDRRLKNDPSAAQLNGQSPIQQSRTKRTYLPWKKRRRALNSQDGGDRSEKAKAATCCDSSKVTVALSDTRIIAKISGQRCLGSESEEKEMQVTTTEALAGGIEFYQSTTQVEIRNSRNNFLRGLQEGLEKKHVECQFEDIVQKHGTCLCPKKLVNKAETSDQLQKKDMKKYFSSPSPTPITSVITTNGTEISSEKYKSPKEPLTNGRSTQYYETDAKPRDQASGAADLANASASDRQKLAVRTRFQAQKAKTKTKGLICECRLFEEQDVEWGCPARNCIEAAAQTSDHVVAMVNRSPFLLRVIDVAAPAGGVPARAPSTTNNTYGL